jgi:signal transduction histidine kinase
MPFVVCSFSFAVMTFFLVFRATLSGEKLIGTAYVILVGLVIVFEGRIKHNEVERFMLREILRTKQSYVRWLSHELRTPLNTTYLGISLLKDALDQKSTKTAATGAHTNEDADTDDADAEDRQILAAMKTACESAVGIVDNLIAFDKMQSGGLHLHRRPVNLREMLYDSAEASTVDARQAENDLTISFTPERAKPYLIRAGAMSTAEELCPLDAAAVANVDPGRCQQLFHALLEHCLRRVPPGGHVEMLVTSGWEPNQQADDDGAGAGGVSTTVASLLAKLPRPFRRSKTSHVNSEGSSSTTGSSASYGLTVVVAGRAQGVDAEAAVSQVYVQSVRVWQGIRRIVAR